MATKPKVDKKTSTIAEKVVKNKATEADSKISDLFDKLMSPSTPDASTEKPVTGLDDEVTGMFQQASVHRDKLVNFFIKYTWVFSIFVAFILVSQATVRTFMPGKESIELIPYWALNLLVVGLVGQFITLLTIVTKKVWLFEEFFKHADTYHQFKPNNPGEDKQIKSSKK